jgi:hypothetical protein
MPMGKVTQDCTTRYGHFNHDKLIRVESSPVRYVTWNNNIVLILRTWRVDKSVLEIYRLSVSTDFVGGLKMHFGELKMRILVTAPIESVWYIRNVFECLEGSKCHLSLKYELHSCWFYLFQKLSPTKFRANYLILVGRRHVWFLKYKHVPNFEDHLPIHPSNHPPNRTFINLSIHLSIHLTIQASIHPSIHTYFKTTFICF